MKLSVKNLSFSYGNKNILKKVNFSVSDGDILLINGENGSGKTTLLKCLVGFINNGKNIFIDDQEVVNNKNLITNMSYVMDTDTLYDYLTVEENIKLYKEIFKEKDIFENNVDEYISMFNITKYKNYLVKELSQGTRHKVYISIMLSRKSKIIILDEPFTSLDKMSQENIMKNIELISKKFQKTVILVTHIQEFSKISNKNYVLCKEEN